MTIMAPRNPRVPDYEPDGEFARLLRLEQDRLLTTQMFAAIERNEADLRRALDRFDGVT